VVGSKQSPSVRRSRSATRDRSASRSQGSSWSEPISLKSASLEGNHG
jgi:hypothetical protein